jgi:hypothetical protein
MKNTLAFEEAIEYLGSVDTLMKMELNTSIYSIFAMTVSKESNCVPKLTTLEQMLLNVVIEEASPATQVKTTTEKIIGPELITQRLQIEPNAVVKYLFYLSLTVSKTCRFFCNPIRRNTF